MRVSKSPTSTTSTVAFLDPEMVREARVEELAGYLKMQVYCRVPVAEIGSHKAIRRGGSTQTKGDERSPKIRCWLVAERGEETQQHRGGEL